MQDLKIRITQLKKRILALRESLDLDSIRIKIEELQIKTSAPDFWQDAGIAKTIMQELDTKKDLVNTWDIIEQNISELEDFLKLEDADLEEEIASKLTATEEKLKVIELELRLSGPYDKGSALLFIHSGTGGIDAQDFAEMLMRMYLRFAENKNWKAVELEKSKGDEAGIKSVSLEIIGNLAYGYLKGENGIHRLVRMSPFDANKQRHTSFALVEVIPVIENAKELELKNDDLRIDSFKASGHGGQGVNTTDSAVRITHLPSGIVVSCQNERSQMQNKEKALQILKSKLLIKNEEKEAKQKAELRGEHQEATWGNQIRSYVMQPYQMIKDHRTKYETVEIDKVLNGDIMPFLEEYLNWSLKNDKNK
ncbi:MAG: peptide chain release factor 2 [bacterium]